MDSELVAETSLADLYSLNDGDRRGMSLGFVKIDFSVDTALKGKLPAGLASSASNDGAMNPSDRRGPLSRERLRDDIGSGWLTTGLMPSSESLCDLLPM